MTDRPTPERPPAGGPERRAWLKAHVEACDELVSINQDRQPEWDLKYDFLEVLAALEESERLRGEAPRLWTCPACAFSFDAAHDDDDAPGHYTCPVCEVAESERLRGEARKGLERIEESKPWANREYPNEIYTTGEGHAWCRKVASEALKASEGEK